MHSLPVEEKSQRHCGAHHEKSCNAMFLFTIGLPCTKKTYIMNNYSAITPVIFFRNVPVGPHRVQMFPIFREHLVPHRCKPSTKHLDQHWNYAIRQRTATWSLIYVKCSMPPRQWSYIPTQINKNPPATWLERPFCSITSANRYLDGVTRRELRPWK